MKRILLVSSSKVHGSGYLEHCGPQVAALFAEVKRVLFVPYALKDHDGYAKTVGERFAELGLGVDSLHLAADPLMAVEGAEGVFIGGGNTFRLLATLYAQGLIDPLRKRVMQGMPYMGSSAGSNVACASIKTSNDMPIVYPPSFDALQLMPFQINPHYIDPDPTSTHMGETRDTRLAEFHEENATPVIGLREGAMLVIEDESILLEGKTGAKLFRQGQEPLECAPGTQFETIL